MGSSKLFIQNGKFEAQKNNNSSSVCDGTLNFPLQLTQGGFIPHRLQTCQSHDEGSTHFLRLRRLLLLSQNMTIMSSLFLKLYEMEMRERERER